MARAKIVELLCLVAYWKAAHEIRDMRWLFADICALVGDRVGRQLAWQYPDEKVTVFLVQSITGLCFLSQVFPRIMFQPASLVTWKVRVSKCWSIVRFMVQVWVS